MTLQALETLPKVVARLTSLTLFLIIFCSLVISDGPVLADTGVA
jgi:hypothetical protein